MWNLKTKQENKLIDIENRLVVLVGRGFEMGKGGQKVQASSYKTNEF